MADWDDDIQASESGFENTEVQGRSFGKGRGFVPRRNEESSGWNNNDQSDFGGRGRGRGGDRGRRGGFGNNYGDRDGSSWGNSNNDSSGRRFNGEDRRGRGGSRDYGGRGRHNDDNQSGGGGWGSSDNETSRGRSNNGGFDNDNQNSGGGWGSSDNGRNDFGSRDGGEERRGRGGRGGGRGRGGRRGSDDDGNGGGWKSGENGNEGDENENGEQKPAPVTYVPQERDENDLFNDTVIQKGINFGDYEDIEVKVTGENKPQPINSFQEAQFRDLVLTNLKRMRYDNPTPIQKYAIPIIMDGRDLMATAQTGSGKTAAFLLPIIHRLLSEQVDSSSDGRSCSPQALVLSPTRELAIQIYENARLYTAQSTLKVQIIYGGVSTRHQSSNIFNGCNILIATPGRLLDFVNRGYVRFDSIKFVVLDEADRMLDMGFSESIGKVMKHETMSSRDQRQTLMFSATFSPEIQKLAGAYLRPDYLFVTVGIVGGACKDVEQNFLQVDRNDKKDKLLSLLEEERNVDGTLLFVEQKRFADFLASLLSDKGFKTTSIHGDRQQFQREEALRDFKTKRMSLLVATNVAARGLDISGVKHVINYDLPKEIDEYVHRIGRTGRLGNKGKATSFYNSESDRALANNLVRILKQANQRIPEFIEQDATGLGDYDSGGFGGYDYRHNEGFKTDSQNQPQPVQDDEDWG